jgi:hypothetical protein
MSRHFILSSSFALTAVLLLPDPSMAKLTADAKTAAGVITVDNAWGAAEESGDTAFVEHVLAPDYRSIGAEGQITDRAAILARVHSSHDPGRTARIAAYKTAHPT